jgi:hypothetical protein
MTQGMNPGGGITPEMTGHPRTVMWSAKTNMTRDIANQVETEAGVGVAMRRIDVKRAKSASQCTSGYDSLLTNLPQAEERQIRGTQSPEGGEEKAQG